MAAVDLPRARRLAASIETPRERAAAYAALAESLGAGNQAVAAECLAEVFRLLALSDGDAEAADIDDARLAAGLLPLAEQIAPERLEEFLWQTISLNHSDQERSLDAEYQMGIASAVAAFVSRYDRDAARLLLGEPETALRTLRSGFRRHQARGYSAFFAALAAIDPHAAVALLDEVSDEGDELNDAKSPREAVRNAVVQFLASQGESRRRTLNKLVGIPDYSEDDF